MTVRVSKLKLANNVLSLCTQPLGEQLLEIVNAAVRISLFSTVAQQVLWLNMYLIVKASLEEVEEH